jgi:TP901 family phage tail tape measure protein
MPTSKGIRAGRAYIELSLDDKLTQGLSKAQAQLSRFGTSIASLGARLTGLGAAIVAPLAASVKSFASLGDQIAKMSRRTGVAVEALSQLKYAAEQSGTSIEAVGSALFRMSRRVANAGTGMGPATRALEELGLSAQKLSQLAPEEQFLTLVEALNSLGDENLSKQFGFEIFGRQFEDLLPLIQQGQSGIRALMQEFDSLGGTLSKLDAERAEALADAFNRLRTSFRAMTAQIGVAFADNIVKILDAITQVVVKAQEWIRINQDVVVAVGLAGAATLALGGSLTTLGLGIKGVAASLGALKLALVVFSPGGAVAIGIAAIIGATVDWQKQVEILRNSYRGVATAISGGEIELATKIASKTFRLEWLEALTDVTTAFERFQTRYTYIGRLRSWALSLKGLTADQVRLFEEAMIATSGIAAVGKSEITGLRAELDGLIKLADVVKKRQMDAKEAAKQKEMLEPTSRSDARLLPDYSSTNTDSPISDAIRRGMIWLNDSWGDVMKFTQKHTEQMEAVRDLWAETRTPIEKYRMEMERIQELLESGKMAPELFDRAAKAARDALEAQIPDDLFQMSLDRGPLLGGARAGQVFTQENERKQDEQLKLSKDQLEALRNIEKKIQFDWAFGN